MSVSLVELLFNWNQLKIVSTSFIVAGLIILVAARVQFLAGRSHDLNAVQAMHTRKTPRLGGVAIFVALALTVWWAPLEVSNNYAKFFGATALLFVVGLCEDLGFHVSPRNRLLSAMAASALVILLLDVWLPRLGVPSVDAWMGAWWLGVPMTLMVTAGVANGFNLIDGVNGLSGFTAIVALLALGQIATSGNYEAMIYLTAMVAACVIGFWLLNFPFGFIFLGDAGAYVLGFIISWFGIAVLLNVPSASPWAIFLTVYWPIADTLLAIYRRSRRRGEVSAPDRLHVHQIVMRALEICILGRKRRKLSNPMTTVVLSPFVVMPPVAGIIFWDQNTLAFAAVVGFSALFFASYATVPKLIGRFRR